MSSPAAAGVTDNFARIAFNISSGSAQTLVKRDQDPVTIEAKYMDYKFCCGTLGDRSTCGIQIGGDGVTKIHAGFRKVGFPRVFGVCFRPSCKLVMPRCRHTQ